MSKGTDSSTRKKAKKESSVGGSEESPEAVAREEQAAKGNPLKALRLFAKRNGWRYQDSHFWKWNEPTHYSRLNAEKTNQALWPVYNRACEIGEKDASFRVFDDRLRALRCDLGSLGDLGHHPSLINFANGVLDLDTLELRKSTREFAFNYVIGIDYVPLETADVGTPKAWIDILERHVPEPEDQDLLEAWLGYSLTDDRTKPQMLILHGPASTGKSTVLNFLQRLLGDELVAKESLRGVIGDPVLAGNLVGKRVTIATEAQISMSDLEAMKSLLSFEQMRIQVLYVKRETVTPTCKFVCSANEDGWLPDRPEIRKRIRVVRFDNPVSDKEQDGKLGERLWEERNAIVSRLIAAYLPFRRAASFDLNQTTIEYLRTAHENVNPVLPWIRDRGLVRGEHWYPVRFLFDLYVTDHGDRHMKLEVFSKKLKDAGLPVEGERQRHPGAEGIVLRSRGVKLANDLKAICRHWNATGVIDLSAGEKKETKQTNQSAPTSAKEDK